MHQTVIVADFDDHGAPGRIAFVLNTPNSVDFDAVKAVKDAVKHFLGLPLGQKVLRETGGVFNWAHVADHLPDSISKQYGFTIESSRLADHVVDCDEQLV